VVGSLAQWSLGDVGTHETRNAASASTASTRRPKFESREEPSMPQSYQQAERGANPKRRRAVIAWLLVAAFVGFMAWTTLRSQKVTCLTCVTFNGGKRCAAASAENEQEAKQSAQQTACGPLATGMDQTIGCGRVVPDSSSCRGS
jgi:hypothetical protein